MSGRKGNDSFCGNIGNDIFDYKFGDGSIILKKFTATTFHVNNDIYQISDSKFVKRK